MLAVLIIRALLDSDLRLSVSNYRAVSSLKGRKFLNVKFDQHSRIITH